MNNTFIFHLPVDSNDMIHNFKLHKILENSRTSIYQNNFARFSVDKNVVRVLVFDKNNFELSEQIKNYFYGEEYENL